MHYFDKNALKLSHIYLTANVKKGATVIDATAGRGRDTLLLSELVGNTGKVYAFDIQKEAIDSTAQLLLENNRNNVTLFLESHDKIEQYIEKADGVVFNFGFLPGGDHKIFSHPKTSIKAIDAALNILADDGFVSLCIYYGGQTGFEEYNAIMDYLKELDQREYTVLMQQFYNRRNCPPVFAVIEKNR